MRSSWPRSRSGSATGCASSPWRSAPSSCIAPSGRPWCRSARSPSSSSRARSSPTTATIAPCCAAGSTLINSGTCFRTPASVLEMWEERFGLDSMGPADLDPYFRRVERIQNVVQVPEELAGQNALVVKRGAERLGWSGDFIYRNVRGCVGSGVCTFGCPTSAKQHVGLTYVPLAWDAGGTTYKGCRAKRIELQSGRARAVEASTVGGGRLRVECSHVMVACGAIGTPVLLARNRLAGDSGE